MKNKKLVIIASTTLAFSVLVGASMPIARQVSSVSAVDAVVGAITVDTNSFWGGGTESYKSAARFYDGDSHEQWSDLVLVEAPDCYFELPYELEFVPTKVDFYKYSQDLSKEDWESNPTSVSPAISGATLEDVEHYVLVSDTYGYFRYPQIAHQIYLEDQDTWTTDTENEYLDVVKINSDHNAEYSIEIELKEKDYLFFEDDIVAFCKDFDESNFVLDESVEEGDLVYDKGGLGAGFECKVSGTYTFKYDHHKEIITAYKGEMPDEPVDPSEPGDGSATPESAEASTGSGNFLKDIFDAIINAFKEAIKDLIAHIKRWFKIK